MLFSWKIVWYFFKSRYYDYNILILWSGSRRNWQICPKCAESRCRKIRHIWDKFVKILPANSSRILSHRKYLYKHKLKAHYRVSFTPNFRSLSIKMGELELPPPTILTEQSGTLVRHIWDKFVKILPVYQSLSNFVQTSTPAQGSS